MLRKTLESNQIPKGTSRLANGPYLHQGLSSIVLITGLEPVTSDVSGRLSNQLIYMSVFVGEEGLEPPSPHGNGFTDRRANQLLNSPICVPDRT